MRSHPRAVLRALATLGLSFAGALFAPRVAEAHSVPRLYASLAPAAAYDPVSGCALSGGGLMLGLGVDPEHDALIVRGDFFGAFVRGAPTSFGFGSAILYRRVFRASEGVIWTWALGGGALVTLADPDLAWAVAGVRGELGVRFGTNVGISAFALAGPSAGRDVRIPWATPLGIMIEVGAP